MFGYAAVSADVSKAAVKSNAGKSKRRNSVLPQLDDDPVLVDSDDEELPVIGANSRGIYTVILKLS